MAIKYGTPGYKYYKDENGRVYGLRDYWYAKEQPGYVNGGSTLSISVRNDARPEWVDFSDFNYYGYGNKYMRQKAQEKADELNARDICVLSIPCTVI
jgi:hypothetical protein